MAVHAGVERAPDLTQSLAGFHPLPRPRPTKTRRTRDASLRGGRRWRMDPRLYLPELLEHPLHLSGICVERIAGLHSVEVLVSQHQLEPSRGIGSGLENAIGDVLAELVSDPTEQQVLIAVPPFRVIDTDQVKPTVQEVLNVFWRGH